MQNALRLKVTAKCRILKYTEEADPNKDTPYEVVEQEIELTGKDAERLLQQLNDKKE